MQDWFPRLLPNSSAAEPVGEEEAPRLVAPMPSQPGQVWVQCSHPAQGDLRSDFLQNWHANRWKERIAAGNYDSENCSRVARLLLLGRPLCRLHAGMIVLAAAEAYSQEHE